MSIVKCRKIPSIMPMPRRSVAEDALAVLDEVLAGHAQADTAGLIILTGPSVALPLLHLAIRAIRMALAVACFPVGGIPIRSPWCVPQPV
jgi:hypothetical protein